MLDCSRRPTDSFKFFVTFRYASIFSHPDPSQQCVRSQPALASHRLTGVNKKRNLNLVKTDFLHIVLCIFQINIFTFITDSFIVFKFIL